MTRCRINAQIKLQIIKSEYDDIANNLNMYVLNNMNRIDIDNGK